MKFLFFFYDQTIQEYSKQSNCNLCALPVDGNNFLTLYKAKLEVFIVNHQIRAFLVISYIYEILYFQTSSAICANYIYLFWPKFLHILSIYSAEIIFIEYPQKSRLNRFF